MYRRQVLVGAPGARHVVRVQRTRIVRGYADATIPPSASGTLPPPPPPPKKRGFLRRTLLYTSIFAGTFYTGSALVSLKSDRYHDFFVESVPGGEDIMEWVIENGWHKVPLTSIPQKAAEAATDSFNSVKSSVSTTISNVTSPPPNDGKPQPTFKERARRASAAMITKIERNPNAPDFSQVGAAVARARDDVFSFSEGVSDLAKEVEGALRGVYKTGGDKGKKQPSGPAPPNTPDAMPTRGVVAPPPPAYDAEWVLPKGKQLYTGPPLPLGFEPPPGYVIPPAPKPKNQIPGKQADVLPLIATSLKPGLSASEPVIAQLASTIDSLAAFVQANPSALKGAQGVLSTAQIDLEKLGERLEAAKAEERAKLEKKIEEQTKAYEDKLLGLEMDSKDRLDKQEEEWKGLFDEEKAKIVAAYRAKLNAELETQSEIINQRLKEEVIAQGIEMQRRWIREIKVRVEQERGGRLAKLDELATGLAKLERTTRDNAAYIDENVRVHGLWSALRAVASTALESEARTPFRDELRVLRSVAGVQSNSPVDPATKAEEQSNPNVVLSAALDTLLASSAPDQGVEPRADLAAWFITSVAPSVRRAALVPDTTAGVLSHIASWAFAGLRFSRPGSSSGGLVQGQDVLSVLSRAEYYLGVKNLDAAAREVNQLTGWPGRLVRDWLDAVRRRLEVEQALEVVQTQATLSSLLVL
ncbi:Formation of crista junctions protein 1 [Ceratobasidium sp. 428]|nr:Formation of crista junctions protein 1 [Ceratobasidium sp. 428]